jgi:hypothetical protein
MPPELAHRISVGVQNLRDQQAEFAIAQDRDGFAGRYVYLVEDFTRGGQAVR